MVVVPVGNAVFRFVVLYLLFQPFDLGLALNLLNYATRVIDLHLVR